MRFDKGLQYLSSAYFQKSRHFEPRLFALFGPASPGAQALLKAGSCVLEFAQFNQRFSLPCRVSELDPADRFAEALFWHNAMFNPSLPPDSLRLAFAPVWSKGTSRAEKT
jgi:hypothetical protein